jgi:hypothetical protein
MDFLFPLGAAPLCDVGAAVDMCRLPHIAAGNNERVPQVQHVLRAPWPRIIRTVVVRNNKCLKTYVVWVSCEW